MKWCLVFKEMCDAGLSGVPVAKFREELLPCIKKSLLRSPEVALFGILLAAM